MDNARISFQLTSCSKLDWTGSRSFGKMFALGMIEMFYIRFGNEIEKGIEFAS